MQSMQSLEDRMKAQGRSPEEIKKAVEAFETDLIGTGKRPVDMEEEEKKKEAYKGFRSWIVKYPEKPYLHSVTYADIRWPRKKRLEATHVGIMASPLEHDSPNPNMKGCPCGIYGYKTAAVFYTSGQNWGRHSKFPWVIGWSSLWGRVNVYSQGYRAQYAYPYELWVPGIDDSEVTQEWQEEWPSTQELVMALRNAYAVDVNLGYPPNFPKEKMR